MRRFFEYIVLLVPLIALADFYKPNDVPASLKPAGFDRSRGSAVKLQTGSGVGCSGTQISVEGHVITALHCLKDCLSTSKNSQIKGFKFVTADVSNIMNGRATCRMDVANERGSIGSVRGTVIAVGSGFVAETDNDDLKKSLDRKPELRTLFSQAMAAGVGISGDFAIIKISQLANRTCARSASKPSLGERVWNIAWPSASSRSGGKGTRGDIAVFSAGAVNRTTSGPVNYNVENSAQALNLVTNRPGIFVSTIDSNVGSSGSGVLNANSEIVGVLNASGYSASDMTSRGSVGRRYAVDIETIKQQVTARFGSNTTAAAFNCR